ncbi:pseudouridine synthase [Cantharellus anzutake]|uniref:pseudouridine synthase n=1 Tax=Cantharellus anzutake TaxID=1750568 RepID=UPI0019062EEE|nr:pseudouridine synthase [Cantharellus anzutake]KAF8326634.1 pseudouridine synthase [Cantharellus anzutake]
MTTLTSESSRSSNSCQDSSVFCTPGLKRIPPYWYPYRTFAKERWWNREILELFSTEFRDRSVEYYRFALESGVVTMNGKVALPGTIVRNGDRIENVVHRHEPPVTSVPIKIIHRDDGEEILVIDKPGSIPIHTTGRYKKNTLVEILQADYGMGRLFTVNRLDRLTSGLMIIGLTSRRAKSLCEEFAKGTVRKEYIARCVGKFPEEEVTVEQPLITVDRQMGLNIVHPEGKYAKTTFNRMSYDETTDTSVLHCRPWTGRSHQIRVHLQYLGHPIANDPIYNSTRAWADRLSSSPSPLPDEPEAPEPSSKHALLPREEGTDIGISSPILLSDEAMTIIQKLRNMKDENDDYSRWRDVVFRAKGAALAPRPLEVIAPPQHRSNPRFDPTAPVDDLDTTAAAGSSPESSITHCSECYLPLLPDPRPDQLFIFLHAWRYTTTEWSFNTDMPFWAAKEYRFTRAAPSHLRCGPLCDTIPEYNKTRQVWCPNIIVEIDANRGGGRR